MFDKAYRDITYWTHSYDSNPLKYINYYMVTELYVFIHNSAKWSHVFIYLLKHVLSLWVSHTSGSQVCL